MKTILLAISNQFRARYNRREQLLLLLCAAVVTLWLLWLSVWQPVMAARATSETRLVYAAASLDDVASLAAELEYLRRSSVEHDDAAVATQSLPQMLDTLSARMGLVAASLEPSADNRSVGLRFDAVSLSDLLQWLAELESQPGIRLDQMTMAPVGGTAGQIRVDQRGNAVTGDGQAVNATLSIRSLR